MSSPVALITGGGSGIGLAVAEHLINFYGYRVAIADIVKERAEEQASRLGSDKCLALHADVTDYEAQCKAFVQAFEWGGNRLDLFFANAGMGDTDSFYKDLAIDPATGLPKPLNLRCMDVNLTAVMQGIHLARHFFEKNSTPGGRIVATSSSLGVYQTHALPQYVTSKHALVGLIRSLAPVYVKDNILINTINPALIKTDIMPASVLEKWDQSQFTPLDRVLKAFDLILKDEKMTGQNIELAKDGLYFRQRPEYSMPNMEFTFEQHELWEEVAGPLMPRPLGENAVFDYKPPTGLIN